MYLHRLHNQDMMIAKSKTCWSIMTQQIDHQKTSNHSRLSNESSKSSLIIIKIEFNKKNVKSFKLDIDKIFSIDLIQLDIVIDVSSFISYLWTFCFCCVLIIWIVFVIILIIWNEYQNQHCLDRNSSFNKNDWTISRFISLNACNHHHENFWN
jgi:hypothetical protein